MERPSRESAESEVDRRLRRLSRAVFKRDFDEVLELTQEMVNAGVDPLKIIDRGLIPGIQETHIRFRKGEFHIPELLTSTMAFKLGANILAPLIHDGNEKSLATVVVGTVKNDLHDIGKNIVVAVLEINGFDVVDLGVDVSPEKFMKALKERHARVLAVSCLLTTTMGWVKSTLDLLRGSGLGKEVKTVIGGAPITPLFAREIGADAYCHDATAISSTIKPLLGLPL